MYTYKIIKIYKPIENQPISSTFNVINKVVILRNFNPIHKCRNKSQNPLFKKTKKNWHSFLNRSPTYTKSGAAGRQTSTAGSRRRSS